MTTLPAPRLEIGDTAPGFTLPSSTGESVSLADLGRVLVYVYPAAMTPGCTTETVDFQSALPTFEAAGISVVGISPDKPEKLAKFAEKHGVTFPLLSDPEKETLAAWAAFGEKKNYGKTVMGVIRSTFLVESDGTIGWARYNVRAKGHVGLVARELGIELPESSDA